jgi:LPXTG-motif cell wall-anchored protein
VNVPPPNVIGGTQTLPADRPTVTRRPSTLPFTGTDTLLLLGLGGSLLVAGGSILLAVRREERRLA